MNTRIAASALAIQTEALLDQVAADRERRCAALRAAADSHTRQIVAAARSEALHHVRQAIAQERARIDQGLRQAEARAEIEARRKEQQVNHALLQHMWAVCTGVLERRWDHPAHRRAWIEAAMAQAGALLSGRAWIVECRSEWPQSERVELEKRSRAIGAAAVEWRVGADVQAGLRIRAEGACIDATVHGLLVQRPEVESAFLAEYLAVAAEQSIHD